MRGLLAVRRLAALAASRLTARPGALPAGFAVVLTKGCLVGGGGCMGGAWRRRLAVTTAGACTPGGGAAAGGATAASGGLLQPPRYLAAGFGEIDEVHGANT